MKKVGLTGGIGSGKSLIGKIFSTLGVPVFIADQEGKKALNEDPEVREEVSRIFGRDIYGKDGSLKRKELADIVFNSPEKLNALNSIVHPAVRKRFKRWCEEYRNQPYVVEEAAVLIESGGHEMMDEVVLVSAPEEVRIQRVVERDGITTEKVRERMDDQWPEEKKKEFADIVILNDGRTPVLERILELHERWSGNGEGSF